MPQIVQLAVKPTYLNCFWKQNMREGCLYNELLCVLTNGKIWHFFFTNLSFQPYVTKEYVKVECQTFNTKKVAEVIYITYQRNLAGKYSQTQDLNYILCSNSMLSILTKIFLGIVNLYRNIGYKLL